MRRSIPLVAAVLGTALTLTACGGGGGETPDAEEPETSTAPTTHAAGGHRTIWVDETRQGAG